MTKKAAIRTATKNADEPGRQAEEAERFEVDTRHVHTSYPAAWARYCARYGAHDHASA